MIARQYLREWILSLGGLVATPKCGIYILNGHFISPGNTNDVSAFRQQLKKLRNSYDFIDIEEAVSLIQQEENMYSKVRAIAFTFDDGFKDCIQSLAPTLNEFGVNACFFVNSGFIDSDKSYQKRFVEEVVLTPGKESMTWDDLRTLDREGFVVGNHTRDHLRLSELGHKEFCEQVLTSHSRIEDELSKPCKYFAWPYGRLSDVTDAQVKFLSSKYPYIFSGDNYQRYFSFNNMVFNRRHFEASWPASHVEYFLSKGKLS